MPTSADHEHLVPLAEALSSVAEHAARADAELLDQQVLVGDGAVQGVVDDLVDDALEALREISTSCRELATVLAGTRPGRAGHVREDESASVREQR